jgi:immunoglobulin-binding protein 1
LSLFSSNESIEEIATSNVKYLLLPAILADLTLKSQKNERLEAIQTAEIYYNDFIQRLNDYQICDIKIKRSDEDQNGDSKDSQVVSSVATSTSLESAARNRNEKINRYKAGKELDNQLKEFREKMSQTKGPVDDEILREYWITLLKRWINFSLDELNSIDLEKPVLKHMLQMKAMGIDHKKQAPTKSDKTPLRPIIIARNEAQKKVYGLGYPSIPTVSVDEFVNQKLEEGTLAITDPNM